MVLFQLGQGPRPAVLALVDLESSGNKEATSLFQPLSDQRGWGLGFMPLPTLGGYRNWAPWLATSFWDLGVYCVCGLRPILLCSLVFSSDTQ